MQLSETIHYVYFTKSGYNIQGIQCTYGKTLTVASIYRCTGVGVPYSCSGAMMAMRLLGGCALATLAAANQYDTPPRALSYPCVAFGP